MGRTQCLLVLVLLCVGLAQSWDIAVTKGDELEYYANDTETSHLKFFSQNLTTLVYDEIHDKMLYVDEQSGGDRICSYDISSSKNNMCHTEVNGRNIHGLAFDPATELLFFSDKNERSINWISLKHGSNNNIYGNLLIKTGDGIPTDLAVDSCRGYVYWINTNLDVPTIERAAFNGSMRKNIVRFSGFAPHSLVVDQLTKRMYFIEPQNASLHYIWYADLNGGTPKLLSAIVSPANADLGLPSSNSLTVSRTFLYSVNWRSNYHMLVWKLPKSPWIGKVFHPYFSLDKTNFTGGIVANYKIKENYQDIQDCEPLTNLVQNNSDEPFCIHGQSVCECSPGYNGERCNVRV